jgi:hypothetical protein
MLINSFKISVTTAILILAFSLFISCEKDYEPNYKSFLIKVDSIQIPENITAKEPFEISFYGTIGYNGCYQFSDFKIEKESNEITIEAWGKFDKNANICPAVMVYLDGEKLSYTVEEKGNYWLKIKQPDNRYLDKQISVN